MHEHKKQDIKKQRVFIENPGFLRTIEKVGGPQARNIINIKCVGHGFFYSC